MDATVSMANTKVWRALIARPHRHTSYEFDGSTHVITRCIVLFEDVLVSLRRSVSDNHDGPVTHCAIVRAIRLQRHKYSIAWTQHSSAGVAPQPWQQSTFAQLPCISRCRTIAADFRMRDAQKKPWHTRVSKQGSHLLPEFGETQTFLTYVSAMFRSIVRVKNANTCSE
jgi:hypothetical protein